MDVGVVGRWWSCKMRREVVSRGQGGPVSAELGAGDEQKNRAGFDLRVVGRGTRREESSAAGAAEVEASATGAAAGASTGADDSTVVASERTEEAKAEGYRGAGG